jgi:serine-type D-Ala-D-Ala carboxypeptidase (penicillin-binding protein 5/6)
VYPARQRRRRRRPGLRTAIVLLSLLAALPLGLAPAPHAFGHVNGPAEAGGPPTDQPADFRSTADAAPAQNVDAQRPAFPRWDGIVAPPVRAASAAVIDAATGALLYGQEPHRRRPPASITKIVTAKIALDRGNLDAELTVDIDGPAFALETDSTIMGLMPGDRLTLRDLLHGLMLPSGNDAAVAIAAHIAGSDEAFAALMNRAVLGLGLTNTRFTNAHGLHDPNHYTSAFDIAQLTRWAMNDPRFRAIVGAKEWTIRGSREYTLYNTNQLLAGYQGADGVKTGWHEEAGATIAGSAVRDGRRLIVVLLNDDFVIPDAKALLDWAFTHFVFP